MADGAAHEPVAARPRGLLTGRRPVRLLVHTLRRRLEDTRRARRSQAVSRAHRQLLAGLVVGVVVLTATLGVLLNTIISDDLPRLAASVTDDSAADGLGELRDHVELIAALVALAGVLSLGLGAYVLRRLVGALRVRDDELSAHAADLEVRVRERTSELSAARDDAALRLIELAEAQAALAESARQAGRADTARRVLHEIGNVLNSVGTSTTTLDGLLSDDGVTVLARLVATLDTVDDLAAFLRDDPRGPQLRPLLRALCGRLAEREGRLRDESGRLTHHVEQLRHIVAAQNAATRASKRVGVRKGVVTGAPLVLRDVVARAVAQAHQRLELGPTVERGAVEITVDLGSASDVRVDALRVGEILQALLDNAVAAVRRAPAPAGVVTVSATWADERLALSVTDDGGGVSPSDVDRLFVQGYSTEPGAAGLGLHTAANLVAELGGDIACAPPAVGQGARFVVTVPAEGPRLRAGPGRAIAPLDPDAVIAALTPNKPRERPAPPEPHATRPRRTVRRGAARGRLLASTA